MFGVRVSVTFHLMCVHWEIAAHSVDHKFSFVFLLFVILFTFCFGFEGWIWVSIVSVPDLCIHLTYIMACTDFSEYSLK